MFHRSKLKHLAVGQSAVAICDGVFVPEGVRDRLLAQSQGSLWSESVEVVGSSPWSDLSDREPLWSHVGLNLEGGWTGQGVDGLTSKRLTDRVGALGRVWRV